VSFYRSSGAVGFALLWPALALGEDLHSESGNNIHGVRLDAHALVGGYYSFGAGLHVDIPIVSRGLISSADDELAISPGLDVYFQDFYYDYYNGGPYLIPSVVLQWNFYLGSDWSVFPEAGLAFFVGDRDYMRRGRGAYAVVDLGFGVRYHFSQRNSLLARVSTPTGLQLGVTF
jgi:hypothetical protein